MKFNLKVFLINKNHFASGGDEVLAHFGSVGRFLAIKEIGVITYFPELNQNILVVSDTIPLFKALLLQKIPVNALLLLGNPHIYVDFHLRLE